MARSQKKVAIDMAKLVSANGVEIDTSEIHDESYKALLVYGFNHFIGNVQQAKVTNKVRTMLAEQRQVKPADIGRSAIEDWRKAHETERAEMLKEFEQSALQELRDGTVGLRESRPRQDERTKRFNRKIAARLAQFLKSQGQTPSNDVDTVYTLRNRAGELQQRTRAQLVEALVASKGEEIWAEVDQELADEAAKAEQAAADDFGLEAA